MSGFDISSLVEFVPPVARCYLCLALWDPEVASGNENFRCPGCNSLYISRFVPNINTSLFTASTDKIFGDLNSVWPSTSTYKFALPEPVIGRPVSIGAEPMAHATELARLAVELRNSADDNPPMRVLMKLLQASRAFVHVTSFNFDEFTLALLEMAAQSTSVAATFSGVDPKRMTVLDQVGAEAPGLEYRVEGTRADVGDQNHGKLIIIDGLLAVIGSPNLTRPAWRKASANMEIVEVVTDIARVAELNNRYFSPLWKRLQPDAKPRYSASSWTLITPEDPEHPDRQQPAGERSEQPHDRG